MGIINASERKRKSVRLVLLPRNVANSGNFEDGLPEPSGISNNSRKPKDQIGIYALSGEGQMETEILPLYCNRNETRN